MKGYYNDPINQTSIRNAYALLGDPADLKSVEAYEKSLQERAETILGDIWGVDVQDDMEDLQIDWYKSDEGASMLSNVGAVKNAAIASNKLPNDKLKTTFVAAGKNSYVFVFMARGKVWLLQVPYSGKITGSGNPKVSGENAKLYDAETTSLGALQSDVSQLIDYLKAQPGDDRDIDVDSDQFAESRKYK